MVAKYKKMSGLLKAILALLGLGLIFGCVWIFGQLFFVTYPAIAPRQIESIDAFTLQWERRRVDLWHLKTDNWEDRDDRIFIQMLDKQAVLLVNNQNASLLPKRMITSFELDTGEINWQTSVTTNLSEYLRNMGGNSDIIVTIIEGYTEPKGAINDCDRSLFRCENIKITAYDAHLGSEIWSIYYANISSVDRLFIDDKSISIDGWAAHASYHSEVSLDVKTGQPLPEFQIDSSLPEFKFDPFGKDDGPYEAVISHFGFESRDIVSNYADNGDIVFFLTNEDGNLWAIDKQTLEVVGKIQFSEGTFPAIAAERSRRYAIAVLNDRVVVYLGDSQQLFSFRFFPED